MGDEDDLDDLPLSTADGTVPPGAGRLIAVGGGRGGVGKSVLAESLAVYFAQLGKPVVLVDADPTGANLHAHFGLSAARKGPSLDGVEAGSRDGDPLAAWNAALAPTSVPGLRLLPAAHDSIDLPLALRASRKARWLSRLRGLPAEYVVVDVGPGHGAVAVDLMLAADLAVVVTVPEPPAIETTYRFLRAAFVRRVRRSLLTDKFRLGLFDRALRGIGFLPSPIELVRALTKVERELANLAWIEARRLRLHLVVNQTRVRADQDLGHQMCDLSGRHYGVLLDELGHVEHDDTVWLAVRRNRPLLIDSPASKAARNMERISRRVLALLTARAQPGIVPSAIPEERPSLYEALAVSRSANDEEVRRAYKRVKEMYAPTSLAISSLLGPSELAIARTRLDEAYETLLDPLRRRAYDLSNEPDQEPRTSSETPKRPALLAEQAMLQHELAREIGPETEFTGALLRKVREAYGVEVSEISDRTKIGKAHLVAIEEEDFPSLPAAVYVRGFVAELAKFLRLDPPQVQRTYLRRMRERLAGRGGELGVNVTDSAPRPRERPAPSSPSFGAALFALAVLPRLYVALSWAGEPVWDGHYYDFGARRIARGLGYSDDMTRGGLVEWHPWCHYPVGYSAFIGFFYRFVKDSPVVTATVNACTGAALAWVTWQLARHALSEGRARIAGLLVAAHPGLILYAGLEMSEPLAALTTLGAFWVAVRDPRRLRGVLLGSLILGMSALVRPQALLCVPFLGLLLPSVAGTGVRGRVATAALASAVALVPVLPWTARNCRVMDGCALISTNAGWNLAIGAFPRATGRFETLRASDGCREVTGQVQQDRCWLEYGLAQIEAAPRHWLALVPLKLGYTFDHESFAVEYLHEARPRDWPQDRRALYRGVTSTAHRLLVTFAALGICGVVWRGTGAMVQGALLVVVLALSYLACSGTPTFWPLVVLLSIVPWLPLPGRPAFPPALALPVALLVTTVVTHAIFFGEDRYHLVVTPVFCLLSAAVLRRGNAPMARRAPG